MSAQAAVQSAQPVRDTDGTPALEIAAPVATAPKRTRRNARPATDQSATDQSATDQSATDQSAKVGGAQAGGVQDAGPDAPSLEAASSEAPPAAPRPMLDLDAVAHIEGLAQEVAVLRASIRRLAEADTAIGEHVKILAELRHQVEALCTALKTQQALEGRGGSARADELAQVLDELGDELGVPR